ncbi:MAG: hypothetical protein EHM59_09180 [Betaproteobacteria bacterium]|nr:MAG: hypothetical protein EHM59_09180 [Betaproteobacteria bacterium]
MSDRLRIAVQGCIAGTLALVFLWTAIEPSGVPGAYAQTPAQSPPYTSISIVAPTDEETVHDNSGTVNVRIAVEPALQRGRGDRVRLSLDGSPLATLESDTFTLTDVDRGAHVLSAAVIDAEGREIVVSPGVTFHMWRASVLFRRK